ncbi:MULTISPECIES: FAD-binding oxidoreductase [Brevibacillus]|uniref:FAD-binding oxidoreductase n=1 Tax=Brevibacillus TaxID=55080 RepID=UPI0024771B86|nr:MULTISPECIES: FAD-linked oxidase C-terminal domain-containing protein [Brevibacillus]MDH6348454.1 glycolate oxidase [Brevibacillus sp. 1238]MDR5002397.1 FAD-linked oxidase C-terminal domain-containing protein [Brevibacillus parabrevis]MED2256454.1 FAD-linked oxidase C-terminal domain-containing protein [Brevibacillus parabrevis]
MLPAPIRAQLRAIVGEKHCLDSQEALVAYSYDATPMQQALPDAVVMPGSTAEVQEVMRLCASARIPVVTRGAGSNLCGGTIPLGGGIVLVLNRMNQIVEIDEQNLTITVQPGVRTVDIHQAVEARGLFYPPDPGSMVISTIGGNIALNSGGLRGLKYGTTKDYVLGLEAVLPSGEMIRTGGKLMKDVAGYDLTKLLVGSEGTLAIITEAILKLIPKPQTQRVMLAMYADMAQAAKSVSDIIANRIIPGTLEFLDQGTIRVVEEFKKVGLPTDVAAILLIGQDGDPLTVDQDMDKIAAICQKNAAVQIKVATTAEEADEVMTARRSALAALSRMRPTTILEDATVPRAAIAPMVAAIQEIASRYGLQICTFGHAGDGNLHPTCMTDARNTEEIERVEHAFEEIFAAAIELGGTITGEHGVGIVKAPYLEWKAGAAGMEVMKGIKQAFDPNHLLNPGKMFAKESRQRVVVQRA